MTEREIYICNIFCNISNKNIFLKYIRHYCKSIRKEDNIIEKHVNACE